MNDERRNQAVALGTDTMYLRVAKIHTLAGGQPLTNATGFFYLHDGYLYLITARHVVINEAAHHLPDCLQVSLHSDFADLRQRVDVTIPLYLAGVPQWWQHPKYGAGADVVAVLINDPHVLNRHCIDAFCDSDILNMNEILPLGHDLLILGFPLGFYDTLNNLPIVRSATLASSFSHPFKGERYFLTDARLHRGMSGSPVIARLPGQPGCGEPSALPWRLLGIHSSALDVSDREPDQDERLALNSTWYASLVRELVSPRRSQIHASTENGNSNR